ncbi:hypothetical protein BGP77_07740 [Saccharospirillum sp. MSK14-1]|nr:hypothetical protein BGP77_07740 [Saccharospirillum sp. MSK14-1]
MAGTLDGRAVGFSDGHLNGLSLYLFVIRDQPADTPKRAKGYPKNKNTSNQRRFGNFHNNSLQDLELTALFLLIQPCV